ncbi:MAG: DEAD/DEAH box helicase family protein [Scytonematopsis contorta HA4267-MV1]|nr:DEAD/DEAH box helicase family protein [Scytonematopsis contorta HA4267-MV1]
MSSNFEFLNTYFPQFLEHASQAENLANTAPRASCFYTRFTLEQAVQWLYANDAYLQLPYDNNLGALIHEQTFKDNLKPGLFQKIRAIHKIGNIAVHDATTIKAKDALHILEELFHFLFWLCRSYGNNGKSIADVKFNSALIPTKKPGQTDLSLQQLEELEAKLSLAEQMRQIAEARNKQTESELEKLKAEITALKQQNAATPDSHNYNEAQTREYLIDVLLKEAGWDISKKDWTEYEVEGMPNDSGIGYVDYVLWGDNGKPLALIEAKRTRKDATLGKRQAELYADCLETRFNQRPVIFYSNGYEHWIWDDANYPPRQIQGFLKKDELKLLIFRRVNRKRLHLVQIQPSIVERSYQIEAIRHITETFDNQKRRKSLLVMATGTGKTRTIIALVDLLMRAGWVKRTLFLADRNALITQALRAFKTHLSNATAIDLTKDLTKENTDAQNANVVLSTYPTISNRINSSNGNQRIFGCGHFDLIIVDEAHRSVYKKYRALFEYFDGLLIGLTATPRNEVHRDTYSLFEQEPGVPTFAYELDDAIKDGYLVPPRGINVPFKFMRQGVKYDELSEAEKEEYEEKFRDDETGEIPDQLNATALNEWLFNNNTADQALELLMQYGLKIDAGERLGKTIIFARNHEHAKFIVKRFDANYPHYQGKFAQAIDSKTEYAQSLLDDFSDINKQPTIVVSVDMLDTGVDVPEILNLVFFKAVYSEVKFNQMIGRGTRLCLGLFGIGDDKKEFFVFDLCSNFSYFQQELKEKQVKPAKSITTSLVQKRLQLINLLSQNNSHENTALQSSVLDELHQHVNSMERSNFLVRPHLQKVEEFSARARWSKINESDIDVINQSLAQLPNGLPTENHLIKRFDLICLQLQIAVFQSQTKESLKKNSKQGSKVKEKEGSYRVEKKEQFPPTPNSPLPIPFLRDKIRDLLQRLEQKPNIPIIQAQLALIQEVQTESWWTDVTPSMIENIRLKLRNLVTLIDPQEQTVVYTDFQDELEDLEEVNIPTAQTGFSPYQYRKKVEAYIRSNENHVAIAKLKRNIPLTDADLTALQEILFNGEAVESKERFEAVYGQKNLKLFIRELVGLDRSAAKEAFGKYLVGGNFNAKQIRFVENIIDYLTQKGVMDPGMLYEPPFTDLHDEGLDGVFGDDDAGEIIDIVSEFNQVAGFEVA